MANKHECQRIYWLCGIKHDNNFWRNLILQLMTYFDCNSRRGEYLYIPWLGNDLLIIWMGTKLSSNMKTSETANRETLVTVILNFILTYVTLSTDVIDNWWNPVKRGFHCFDKGLNNPLYPNTVPTKILFVFALGVPPLVIFIAELCAKPSESISTKWRNILKTITDGFFGFVCICLLTNMTKYIVGRPR